MRVVDGSGLSFSARVTPTVLAKAVLASLDTPALAGVAAGLPVAGLSGTLKDRFDDKAEKVARGNVHAKTGTLVGVAALAGYLTTADGARLVFAIIANKTRGQTTAYNWLDRSTAVLVRCGCR
jgi:D-alanyl-D-alanine carboxypeptidase/D-alanyl-D-alanine-endopeptidase (penicillin-binding protein 4)